ncbi:MAG: hypothetical protein JWN75_248 [Candidatus Saccharibacteria bacterium]|nr:hypothetical protein [Candidatus Saccharibacteria bacterium]
MGNIRKLLSGIIALTFILSFGHGLLVHADGFNTISGRFLDRSGNPISGATLDFLSATGNEKQPPIR